MSTTYRVHMSVSPSDGAGFTGWGNVEIDAYERSAAELSALLVNNFWKCLDESNEKRKPPQWYPGDHVQVRVGLTEWLNYQRRDGHWMLRTPGEQVPDPTVSTSLTDDDMDGLYGEGKVNVMILDGIAVGSKK